MSGAWKEWLRWCALVMRRISTHHADQSRFLIIDGHSNTFFRSCCNSRIDIHKHERNRDRRIAWLTIALRRVAIYPGAPISVVCIQSLTYLRTLSPLAQLPGIVNSKMLAWVRPNIPVFQQKHEERRGGVIRLFSRNGEEAPLRHIPSYTRAPIHLTNTTYQHAYSQDQISKWRCPHFSISDTKKRLDNPPRPKLECLFGNLAPGTVTEHSTRPCCWLLLINAYKFPSFSRLCQLPVRNRLVLLGML